MRRNILLVIGLLAAAPPLHAGTFSSAPLSPEVGLDRLTRAVTRERVGRDLFANPYATVTISNVDVYDRFPYVESRNFQIVSDPRWNRLIGGEAGKSLVAWDGAGTTVGPLAEPRGMAVDEQNRLYVADAGNNRIVVLQVSTTFDRMELTPVGVIAGLSRPWDVAHSDAGTPFVPADDILYVADTGKNRIVCFALGGSAPRQIAAVGELGSGVGRFAGPMAIAVGRGAGASTPDVFVADAHNRRLVHLRQQGATLAWVGEAASQSNLVTSLDADQWGNLYAAAPLEGVVRKYTPALEPVASLSGDLARPRGFHVAFANVRDHRDGTVSRVGRPSAVSVENWSDQSGVRLWTLGLDVEGLAVSGEERPSAHFLLTDPAAVTVEVIGQGGRALSRRTVGTLAAGMHAVPLEDSDLAGVSGDLRLRVTAVSSYSGGATQSAEAGFHLDGLGAALPSRAALLGNWPNPVAATTRIAFVLPQAAAKTSLAVFDAAGRRVRTFPNAFVPGRNEVSWDATDDAGRAVGSGLYFIRLEHGAARVSRSMVVVH